MRDPCRELDPLLADGLEPDVERGRHPQAALLKAVAGRLALATQLGRELVADRPHEMGCRPARRDLRGQGDRLLLGGSEVRGAVRVLGHGGPVTARKQVQDGVAAGDDLRVLGDHQRSLGGRAFLVLLELVFAQLHRVAYEVVVGRGLGQSGEDGGLGRGQLGELFAEVAARGGLHAVGLIAVVVLVEVGGDDLLLALDPLEMLGDPDRLDDLLELALGRPVGVLDEVWR
jgi:hypothetical protein